MEPGLIRQGLPAEPGVYVLWLRLSRSRRLPVPRLGAPCLGPGLYGYVGSARGPGGLSARLGRHLAGTGIPRWHVDHLRRVARVAAAWWWITNSPAAEDAVAGALEMLPDLAPAAPGFGAGDSRRATHLFFARAVPDRGALERLLNVLCDGGEAVPGIPGLPPRGR